MIGQNNTKRTTRSGPQSVKFPYLLLCTSSQHQVVAEHSQAYLPPGQYYPNTLRYPPNAVSVVVTIIASKLTPLVASRHQHCLWELRQSSPKLIALAKDSSGRVELCLLQLVKLVKVGVLEKILVDSGSGRARYESVPVLRWWQNEATEGQVQLKE